MQFTTERWQVIFPRVEPVSSLKKRDFLIDIFDESSTHAGHDPQVSGDGPACRFRDLFGILIKKVECCESAMRSEPPIKRPPQKPKPQAQPMRPGRMKPTKVAINGE